MIAWGFFSAAAAAAAAASASATATAAAAATASASLPWPWSWGGPAHQLTWGTSSFVNCTGREQDCMDSERELDIMLTRDIVYVQGFDFARELHQDDFTNALMEIEAIRAHQKKKNSSKPYAILPYRGIVVGPDQIQNSSEYAGFWLTDDAGTHHPGRWDFRNASARQFYIDDLLRTHNRSNSDGIFIDTGDAIAISQANLTVKSRQEIFNATAMLWRELTIAANKGPRTETDRPIFLVTPSLKNHMPITGPVTADGQPLCNVSTRMSVPCSPYTEQAIYDIMGTQVWGAHRQFNIPSRDFGKDSAGCVSAVHTAIEQGKRGPQMLTCNGCNHTSEAGLAMFNISFAAYLMGAKEYSYFGAGTHFHNDSDWDYAWPDLNRPIGAPLGDATLSENSVFSRHFEHLSAHVDCISQTGRLEWR